MLTEDPAEAIVAHLPDGVMLVRDGVVIHVNAAFEALTGIGAAEVLAAPAPSLPAHLSSTVVPVPDGELVIVREPSGSTPPRSELERLAHHDGLTGLLNHRAFWQRLDAACARYRAEARPLSLVVLDLDHFKAINDEHGHPVGDQVLAETATRLRAAARRGGDMVARTGGEEFAWLLPGVTAGEALEAAERLRSSISERPYVRRLPVTASIGVCELDARAGAESLFSRADEALYWAKGVGRDTVLAWTPEIAARLPRAIGADLAATELLALTDEIDPGHGELVADLAVGLAAYLDWLPAQEGKLHLAARLHDVGKTALPASLLSHADGLSPAQRSLIRSHSAIGAGLAAPILGDEQQAWIRGHHERWDGLGYPDGTRGDNTTAGGQLIAIADAWVTMTSDRPYRRALAHAEALDEIRRGAGTQFRPDAVELLEAARGWWRTT